MDDYDISPAERLLTPEDAGERVHDQVTSLTPFHKG
jgi:hypothetical protein